MKKIKYFFRRLKTMKFKSFFNSINEVHKESEKAKIVIFFDIIICSIKYGSGHLDYKNHRMYKLSKENRNKILTVAKNNEFVRTLNNPEYRKYFDDKYLFNQIFEDYIKRDFIKLDGKNVEEFKKFLKNKKYVFVKPLDACCGSGIEKIKVSEKNPEELYKYCIKNQTILVEEMIIQDEKMNKLFDGSINTIRIVTILNNKNIASVIASYVRIGRTGNVVDNFNHGGISCVVDRETGKIVHDAVNKLGETFTHHPDTNTKLVGFQIPYWDEIKEFCKKAALVVPEVRYVGWDVAVSEKGLLFVEGNSYPGQDLEQIPEENIGTVNTIIDALQ